MTKAEFAQLIDAYADSKASGNKYLVKKMIEELEGALNEIFGSEPLAEGNPITPEVAPEGEY
jgi:hypothetical protein